MLSIYSQLIDDSISNNDHLGLNNNGVLFLDSTSQEWAPFSESKIQDFSLKKLRQKHTWKM